jgi:hypothetical protein
LAPFTSKSAVSPAEEIHPTRFNKIIKIKKSDEGKEKWEIKKGGQGTFELAIVGA